MPTSTPVPAGPAPVLPPGAAPAPRPIPGAPLGELTAEERALCAYAGVAPTRVDYEEFLNEMGAIHDQNAIGPGVSQPRGSRSRA